MRVGIVAPTKFLKKYCVTGLQVCYSSLTGNTEYRNFYREASRKGDVVILDHSPNLPRKPSSDAVFLNSMAEVLPTAVVLPNFDFDYSRTISRGEWFTSLAGARLIGITKIGVVQGQSLEELNRCIVGLDSLCDMWALPCSLENIGPRFQTVPKLDMKGKPYIYLEVNKEPLLEIPPQDCVGIVTSYPLRLAYCSRAISEGFGRPKPLDFDLDEDKPRLAKKNIEAYMGVLGC